MLTPDRGLAEKVDTSKLYTHDFLKKINASKEKFRLGKADEALRDLNAIKEHDLLPSEKSTRQNLMGVIVFSQAKYVEAENFFNRAIPESKADPVLEAQIYLNLSSAQYKINEHEKALTTLSQADFRALPDGEAKKYHQLHAVLAEHLGKRDQTFTSMIHMLADKKTIAEIRSESHFKKTQDLFKDVSPTEKVRRLEEFDGEKNMAVAALAIQEGEAAKKTGDQDRAKDYAAWIEKRYPDNAEMMVIAQGLKSTTSADSNAVIDIRYIGVALPLSGERKSLGERALNGIDIALEELSQNPLTKYRLEIKDTQSNSAIATLSVKDLIEQNNVAAIIGGLIPATATKEYQEAKKHGVLFISLSPVYLPKEEKNHLLIEISGSIESQVNQIFSQKMLNKLGTKPAIIYPKSELGEAYANEFWRRAKLLNLEVTGVVSYDKNDTDFRDPIKNILGIKFTRERDEEAALVSEISSLEKNKNIKRLQSLQPQVDFDWVFVPALPKDVVQLLPNFNFYDAFNLSYVGVPSWRSELMNNEGYRYGNVYFVDETAGTGETLFSQTFAKKFNRQPKIVETIAYDAIKIFASVQIPAAEGEQIKRQNLEVALEKKETLQGESGNWKLNDGIWIKELSGFKIKRDGVEAI
jgi:ABC-type branched-subunit amino acid transport system substrate-binding protein